MLRAVRAVVHDEMPTEQALDLYQTLRHQADGTPRAEPALAGSR
jgi:hypothetical protein